MPCYCEVYGCKKDTKGVVLHSFPIHDENRLHKWIQFANRGPTWVPKKNSKICSLHFANPEYSKKRILSDPTMTENPPKKIKKVLSYSNFEVTFPSNSNIRLKNGGIIVGSQNENTDEVMQLTMPKPVDVLQKTKDCNIQIQHKPTIQNSVSTQTNPTNEQLTIKNQNSIIKRLTAKIGRDNVKMVALHNEVVKQKNRINRLSKLNNLISKSKNALLLALVSKLQGKKLYDQKIRQFAMTLQYYSSKAYEFVRTNLNKCLPSCRQITRYSEDLNVNPGFLIDCLDSLKEKSKSATYQLYCNVQMDEMSIRQQIVSNGKSYEGYVDYGEFYSWKGAKEDASNRIAKNALVVMAVGVNGHWKVPIAYFLTSGVPSTFLANILTKSIEMLQLANIICMSVTYDGLASNLSAAKHLGASFEPKSIKPWFAIPSENRNVYVVPDVCHMLKLLRNLWKKIDTFYLDGQKIRWTCIERLAKLQHEEGLRSGNKLSSRHIHFEKQIMKVKLAAQLFSNSNAKSLRLCYELKVPGFYEENCLSTAEFLELVDRLFHCLNSRNILANGYRSPMKKETECYWKTLFDKAYYVFGNIKTSTGILIVKTKKKTAVIGFLACILSFQNMYNDYVLSKRLSYILTYKFSQDHTEVFFSVIRSCGGFNTNLNAVQFRFAMRKVLCSKILAPNSGNCNPQDTTESTLSRKFRPSLCKLDSLTMAEDDENNFWNLLSSVLKELSSFGECVVTYIAGWVVRKAEMIVKCTKCKIALYSDSENNILRDDYKLLRIKQNGGLRIPSKDVVTICKATEKIYRAHSVDKKFQKSDVINKVKIYLLPSKPLFSCLDKHLTELSPLDNHIYQLVELITDIYCKVRMHHSAKSVTLQKIPYTVRNQNNHLTHFSGV